MSKEQAVAPRQTLSVTDACAMIIGIVIGAGIFKAPSIVAGSPDPFAHPDAQRRFRTVADLFAGSGALGIEALSRGAAHCLFAEQDRAALDVLRANLAALGATDRAEVRATSVLSLGSAPRPYDVILMDPPYGTGAGAVALDKLARLGWTDAASWISIETGANESVQVGGFTIDAERKVGKAKLTLLRAA